MDEEAAKAEAERIEAALQKLAAEKRAEAHDSAAPRPEWERFKEANRKVWTLPISERLELLRQMGRLDEVAALEAEASRPIDPDKPQRSNVPEPIEALRGSGVITRTARPQEPRKIAWPLWLASPRVALWEAVALVLNIEPSSLEPLRDGWMAGPGRGPFFERRSFPTPKQRDQFEKALSFAERAANVAGPIHLRVGLAVGMNKRTAEVTLSEVVAFLVSCEWPDIPAELLTLRAAPEPAKAQAAPHEAPSNVGQQKVWTEARKAEARAYREKHGLKRTAEHYGVSQSTISKQIPPEKEPKPQPYSAFNQRKR
jgi:hypothetical protein